MKNKIFAFVGSRSAKRNTYGLVEKIITEIDKNIESDYEILTMNDVSLKPCIGCGSCGMVGECVLDDDFPILREKILEADLFIVGAPVYIHGLPGEMKNIIDRLVTWAHTLRLAGKNILIVSTCDTNGHCTVVDDLHIKMLHMGGRIVGKYVGANYIPEGVKFSSNVLLMEEAEKELSELIQENIKNIKLPIKSNKFNEDIFKTYKNIHKQLVDLDMGNGETDFWVKSGMINCETFQEYLDGMKNRKE